MSSSFYVPGEHRAERVEDLFATIAPRYDLINDLQSLGLWSLVGIVGWLVAEDSPIGRRLASTRLRLP